MRAFTLAKDPAHPESNEDAWELGTDRLVLSDGASSDAFSGLWAHELCAVFLEHGGLERDLARARWQAQLPQPLPWFLADKLRQPTHASFLGLDWSAGRLRASAVGDSTVFVIRDEALALAFPCTQPADFTLHPALIPTTGPLPSLQAVELPLEPGDTLLAATDALAAWILHEQAHTPWRSLLALQHESDFHRFVTALRQSGRIALDDTTLCIVTPEYEALPDTRGSSDVAPHAGSAAHSSAEAR